MNVKRHIYAKISSENYLKRTIWTIINSDMLTCQARVSFVLNIIMYYN